MSLKWIIVAILALPVAELVAFLLVAGEIGLLRAVALQVAASLVGFLLLRHAGSAQLSRLRADVAAHRASTRGLLGPRGALVLAGILLFIPGFITDACGLAVLVPPVRRRMAALARGALMPRRPREHRPDPVIDLAPDEWREVTKSDGAKKRRAPRRR
jgi:UPF0716 protein FxsA